MSDDLHDDLLTGDGKWWEFLDPQTYEVKEMPGATRSSGRELDWTARRNPGVPIGFSYANHCSTCGQMVPPDFAFCVHCGGEPRGSSPIKTFSIVVTSVDGEFALDAMVELFVTAGAQLSVSEVRNLFTDPPVVFNVTGRREQVSALAAKLSEIGVGARAFSLDDPSVPWIRETFESLTRNKAKLGSAILLTMLGLAGAFLWSPLALVFAIVAFGGLLAHELSWYRDHYHLRLDVLLLSLTGFDLDTARVAREALGAISDREARSSVTICLMEYYTLTQQLRSHGVVYGAVLSRTGDALEELMADVLTLAHRYARVDAFLRGNPRAAIEQRLDELSRDETDPTARRMAAAETSALREQLDSMARMEEAAVRFKERLGALARAMESMRARFAAVRARPSVEAFESLAFEEALEELDHEFEVFEAAFATVG